MKIRQYQIDAFARKVFEGNPAAVCPLENWLNDAVLQAIEELSTTGSRTVNLHRIGQRRLAKTARARGKYPDVAATSGAG